MYALLLQLYYTSATTHTSSADDDARRVGAGGPAASCAGGVLPHDAGAGPRKPGGLNIETGLKAVEKCWGWLREWPWIDGELSGWFTNVFEWSFWDRLDSRRQRRW